MTALEQKCLSRSIGAIGFVQPNLIGLCLIVFFLNTLSASAYIEKPSALMLLNRPKLAQ
jgi:hypothetical protein